MTLALLDGDIYCYRAAASCMPSKTREVKEPEYIAISRLDESIYRTLDRCAADEYRVYLSGTENFRSTWYPDYKANRRKLLRPDHLDACRDFLVREWGAKVMAGCEADDGIGIDAIPGAIICSIDKDLRQIPGVHYQFVKDEFVEVGQLDAIRNFYTQMLVGDTSDNVSGVDRIGAVRAERALRNRTPSEMESIVREAYGDGERYILNYRLLRVVRTKEEMEEIETLQREGQGPQLTEACRFSYSGDVPGADEE